MLLATITGFLLVGAASAVEASVVAIFGHGGPQAGIVLGIWAIGSLFGGLLFGHLPIGPWALARRMFIVFVGMALAMIYPRLLVAGASCCSSPVSVSLLRSP